jgi:glycerophosphoryl diester phosphodiesterase
VLVVAHDRRLNPDHTRDPAGAFLEAPGPAIFALTLAELRRYDVGALKPGTSYAGQFPTQHAVPGTPVPTLEEVVALARRAGNERVRFNLETKLSPLAPDETPDPAVFARLVVDALRAHAIAERSTVQSFDWRTLRHVQRLAPEIPTACLTLMRGRNGNLQPGQPGPSPWTAGLDIDDFGGSAPRLAAAAGCRVWSPSFRDLTDAALAEARALGLATTVWTVNEPADMARLIDMGVDGIITDYPDRLRMVAQAHGLAVPEPTPVAP